VINITEKTGCLIVFLFLSIGFTWSQNNRSLDSLTTVEVLDSLLIDHDRTNYSFRLFSNFKSQRFRFAGSTFSREYAPNNRAGLGFGVASEKLLIDIAFNIKSKDKEPTDRFDIRASYKWQKHFIDFFFQYYKGFNVTGLMNTESTFRSDVISIASGINYLYLFNEDKFQVGTLRSVISEPDNTDFSYGVGGFLLFLDQEGNRPFLDGSEVSQGEKIFLAGIGGGLLTGVGGFFSMGSNLYSSISLNAGLGLMHKNVNGDTIIESSSNPMVYQINSVAVLGYVKNKFYLNLSFELGFYETEILRNVDESIWVSQAKLAFGFKPFN
jgi:hypothetical protein